MRRLWRIWDRILLLGLIGILAMSTGAATVALGDMEGVTGHTGYVSMVRVHGAHDDGDRPPVEYGLAIQRESWLFGLKERTRPLAETTGRMVFVWSDQASDPRDAVLVPTGSHARLVDARGELWTVHEFTYGEPLGPRYYTYGVLVGETRDRADTDDGRYNWALTYRADRLFPATNAAPQAAAGAPNVQDLVPGVPLPVTPGTADRDEPTTVGRLLFGTGMPPARLAR